LVFVPAAKAPHNVFAVWRYNGMSIL